MDQVKSGIEIINGFLESIQNNESLDQSVCAALLKLHQEGRLTDKAIANELENLREIQSE